MTEYRTKKISYRRHLWLAAAILLAMTFLLVAEARPIQVQAANRLSSEAQAELDLTKTGSILLTMRDEKKNPVPGGTLLVYKVASMEQNGQGYTYVYTPEFQSSGVSIDDLNALPAASSSNSANSAKLANAANGSGASSQQLAKSFAAYVSKDKPSGYQTISIGSDGKAVADNNGAGLGVGLYFVTQGTPAKGYHAVTPFLISLPGTTVDSNGTITALHYNVDALPKMDPLKPFPDEPTNPDNPTNPENPTKPETPTTPETPPAVPKTPTGGNTTTSQVKTASKLPQSGQLWWPVWILSGAGCALIVLGMLLHRRQWKRSQSFETK